MGLATHLGPWLLGTIKNTTGTTVGTIRNIGATITAQTANITFSNVSTSPTAVQLFALPAGSKIIRFNYENTTAYSGGGITAINATMGSASSAALYQASVSIGLTAIKLSTATADAGLAVAQTNNVGTSDILIFGTFTAVTGNPTAGATVITCEYLVRNPDGSIIPSSTSSNLVPSA